VARRRGPLAPILTLDEARHSRPRSLLKG